MGEMIKMVLVLTALSLLSGILLAFANVETKQQIEDNVIKFVKGPALKVIFEGASNEPLTDRFTIGEGKDAVDLFVAKYDGQVKAVALETKGKGYGGDVGLLLAVDITEDKIFGVGVTEQQETAGLGAMAKEDPAFAAQFKGLSILEPVGVSGAPQTINAIGGATITSKAVCNAANEAGKIYQDLKPQITEELKKFSQ